MEERRQRLSSTRSPRALEPHCPLPSSRLARWNTTRFSREHPKRTKYIYKGSSSMLDKLCCFAATLRNGRESHARIPLPAAFLCLFLLEIKKHRFSATVRSWGSFQKDRTWATMLSQVTFLQKWSEQLEISNLQGNSLSQEWELIQYAAGWQNKFC